MFTNTITLEGNPTAHTMSHRDSIGQKGYCQKSPSFSAQQRMMAHPKSWCEALGRVTCSVMEKIIVETAYGSYCTSGFLKPLKIFPHQSCELEKMFSLPAVEYHSVSYSMHHLVLFLKDICFTWGKYSIFLMHFSVEKHFFWYSAKVSFLSQPTPP